MTIELVAKFLRDLTQNPATRDLSHEQVTFLTTLGEHETPVTVGTIGRAIGWKTGQTSRVVTILVQKGMVERLHPEKTSDQRYTLVRLTTEGHEACQKLTMMYRRSVA